MQIEVHDALSAGQKAEWRAFTAAARHQHPRQDPVFADVEQANGSASRFALGRSEGRIVAVGLFTLHAHPILRGAVTEATCLSGPVCDNAATLVEFLAGVMQSSRFSRTGAVSITPYWLNAEAEGMQSTLTTAGWQNAEADMFRNTGLVDLQPGPDQILAAFSKSARREVRRASRQNVTVHSLAKPHEALAFLHSLNRLRLSRRLPALDEAGFMTSFELLYREGDAGILLGAHQGNTFLAGLLLYRSRHVAHGRHFTNEPGALQALANLRIAPVLWAEGMRWAHEKGCTTLDVEGYEVPSATSGARYNIYKYKSEFSPTPALRAAEHRQILRPLIYFTGMSRTLVRRGVGRMLRAISGHKS